ncbi:MAG TPA: tyrosine-type recombinase/integrase [Ktedonobacteraceae bacterium]|nr:tyrosine-type recombinase/integrase [Ktedonobacteraceae bacterium]
MKLTEVIEQYLIDCRARNLSDWTIDMYNRSLHLLSGTLMQLCGVTELEQVTVMHLRLCVQHLLTTPYPTEVKGRRVRGETLSARSVRDYVLVWKAFFNWCYQEELIEKNPVTRLKTPVIEKRIKPTLTPDELQMMLDFCDIHTSTGFRDYAILSLLADSGIRLAEIAGLQVGDIHAGYIKVFGKGRKEREVGLHPGVGKILWKYIQKYRRPRNPHETALFLGRWGDPLGTSGVYEIVDRIKKRCGFEDKEIHPHVFRHTFSKQYMERGGDILSLSRELGHSDIQVTRLYLQDFGSTDARKDHNSRSIFNDIRVSRRGKQKRKRGETES